MFFLIEQSTFVNIFKCVFEIVFQNLKRSTQFYKLKNFETADCLHRASKTNWLKMFSNLRYRLR